MQPELANRISAELPHTKKPGRRALLIERVVVITMIALPMLGAGGGLAFLVHGHLQLHDHVLFALMYLVTGFGITIGYHRLFTHRAFETSTPLRVALAMAGGMAFQGPVIRWVADHRRHHAFTDLPGDPHSPLVSSAGRRPGRWRGIWHAHLGWLFAEEKSMVRHYAADLLRDPWIAWVDRHYPVWIVLSVALPGAIGYALSGSAAGAWHGFLWAGLTRICAVQHVTWAVNSVCHSFGRQPLGTGDESRNHPIMAVLALGEGWHNNHHAQPSAAVQGFRPGEIDLSGLVVRMLERIHLVWRVRHSPAPDDFAPARARFGWKD